MPILTPILHPSFTFNGLAFSKATLKEYAEKLQEEGATFEVSIGNFITQWLSDEDTIEVQTSGSTGSPKRIQLQKKQMLASAKATGQFFDIQAGTSALLCLSAEYIAGKMMLVRAMTLGWQLHAVAPEKDTLAEAKKTYDFVAMVPYQVHHSVAHLHRVKKLIVGGGSVTEVLREKLQDVSTQVFETYGMTETITHVAIKAINGADASTHFKALPEVKFSLDERGCLVIDAPKISSEKVVTNDMVVLISDTIFKWLGRYDAVINSGGVKIHPELVEAILAPHISIPFVITSEPDEQLGNKVIIAFEIEKSIDALSIEKAFTHLSAYQKPKRMVTLSKFPYTETGKIKRKDIIEIINKQQKKGRDIF